MEDVVIISGVRTPIAKFQGALEKLLPRRNLAPSPFVSRSNGRRSNQSRWMNASWVWWWLQDWGRIRHGRRL